MTRHTITISHNFETAHRLPTLGGKCTNLHGHSWWATITVTAPYLSPTGTVVEYGALKREVREWIDQHLDHGAMLGADDALAEVLAEHGSKVYIFGRDPFAEAFPWPTVENVAAMLAGMVGAVLSNTAGMTHARVVGVSVQETHVNTADVVLSPETDLWGEDR